MAVVQLIDDDCSSQIADSNLTDNRLVLKNPYDSPKGSRPKSELPRSPRIFTIVSLMVVACWGILLCVLVWATSASVEDGELWFKVPGQDGAWDPDSVVTEIHFVHLSVFGAALLFSVLFSLSLLVVNGFVALIRNR